MQAIGTTRRRSLPTPREAFLVVTGICAALLGYGYYLEYAQGLQPCPLCLVQRGFFYAVGGTALVGALHGPRRAGTILYSLLLLVFSAGGAATAGRQVWLQHLPPEKVPACGPDLLFMLENFPLMQTVQKLFKGTGECAVVDWTFLGLSIAGWALVCFAAFGAYALWLMFRNPGSEPEPDYFPQVDGKYR
jgi:disulfide bond formation protein DsbB